jgi:hypothetical protein
LTRFSARWQQREGTLAVEFREVISDPTSALGRIQDHFGLERHSDEITLDRMRWSRGAPEEYATPSPRRSRLLLGAKAGINGLLRPLNLHVSRIDPARSSSGRPG